MPGPRYRTTIFFSGVGYGWSESYWNNSTDLSVVQSRSLVLAKARAALLVSPFGMKYMRFSDDYVKGDARILDVSALPNTKDSDIVDGGEADLAPVAILARLEAGAGSRRMIMLRGIPDGFVQSGVGTLDLVQGLRTAFNKFAKVISLQDANTQGWCVRSINPARPKGKILTAIWANGSATITPAGNAMPLVGDTVKISGVKGMTALNGTFRVSAVAGGTFSVNIFAEPGIWQGGGQYARNNIDDQTLTPIDNCVFIRAGKRNTGRPFNSPRGQKSRVRK